MFWESAAMPLSIKAVLRQFRRDEGGALIVFALLLFVLMVMKAGLAVDLMRYENTRVRLQNAFDRSTLAAAALSQKQDRAAVVRDYMTKAGLADQLASVSVTTGQNATTVATIGRADTEPMFLYKPGIRDLDALSRSTAEQSITDLEIALVLDISGSMSGAKIASLKVAARTFVDKIMASDPDHRASITIVPYNAQVNIGADLVSAFNVSHENGVANNTCIEIPEAAFDRLALSQTDPLPMMAYADITSSTGRSNAFVAPTDRNHAVPSHDDANCRTSRVNVVRLPSNDRDTLKAQIAALEVGGKTSITPGMKWGATLIDPSMRPAYARFADEGKIPANLPNRPFAYDDGGAVKIIVLMTDGEHVAHNRQATA